MPTATQPFLGNTVHSRTCTHHPPRELLLFVELLCYMYLAQT